MWGGCSLQDPSARLEARPGYCGHLALGCQTGARQATPASRTLGCSHLALGLPSLARLGCQPVSWVDQAYTWCLGSALVLGTPLRARGAWAACLGAEHIPARTWRLGCTGRDPCPRPTWDTIHLSHATGPKGNGSGVKTHDERVESQDPIIIGFFIKTPGS